MEKILAIKGHPTRGKEVIELLEMIGGINDERYIGTNSWKDEYYFLDNGYIRQYDWCDGIKFTLEEFLEKYPFKVGDKVFLYDNITEGCVTGMEWDEEKGTVKYCVYTSSECWCDVEELLKWNTAIDLVERHYEKQCNDMDKTMFMIGPVMVPDKVDDKLEYYIIDGYEFDRVENGKIILKPIKPKYPTTYVECCKVMGINYRAQLSYTNPDVERGNTYLTKEKQLLDSFMRLRICRNAYWKIAGEEMGLDKPWGPDWTDAGESKYCIVNKEGIIDKWIQKTIYKTLAFPTEEMRDAFYENFKDLIEQCKKLL